MTSRVYGSGFPMKHILLILFLTTAVPALAQTPSPQEKALALAAQSDVEALLDQSYAGTDNPRQQVDLFLPRRRQDARPLPVIALIHGGAWRGGDRLGRAGEAIRIAATGRFATVSIGYRLTGEASWPTQAHDAKAAIRWIRAHAERHGLDPEAIAVWGSSAGGHLASLLGTSGGVPELEGDLGPHSRFSSRVQAVVNLCGPQDLAEPLMFDDAGRPVIEDDAVIGLLGGTSVQKPADARAASPVTYVSADDPPFISFHGSDDRRVDVRHAERIHAALHQAGVPSLLVLITGGGHGSVTAPDVHLRGLQFADRILRGQAVVIDTSPIAAPDPIPAPDSWHGPR